MARPRAHETFAPRELFSWDITYLSTAVKGQYFYLYLFLDVFSRKAIGHEVHSEESAEHSSALLTKICAKERIDKHRISLHSDNGGPMKGVTVMKSINLLKSNAQSVGQK